jgi:hypothetical protein
MLCLLHVGRKKEKKKRGTAGALFFSQGRTHLAGWLCHVGFSLLLGAIKG